MTVYFMPVTSTFPARAPLEALALEELTANAAPEPVRRWIASPRAWLEFRTPAGQPDSALIEADLDAGEFEAILLAGELSASELIIADK
jgi:predicted nucleic acid-binding protein